MEKLYATCLEERYEALAHHFIEGNNLEKAVVYCRLAGAKAAARSAFGQAVAYFEQALSALGHLSESRETLEQAIAIRIDLGPVLRNMKSNVAPEVAQTYTEARELCRRLGDTPLLFPVLWGLSRAYHARGELHNAREIGEQLFSLAQRIQDPALILEAHHTLWATLSSLGELLPAKEHCERGQALYDPQQHRQHAFLYGGHDPGVCCGNNAAQVLWLLGYPDQALQRSQEALVLAHELSHPYSLAYAIFRSAEVHQLRGERDSVQGQTEAGMILATKHGFPRWVMVGALLRGWLSIEEGYVKQGIGQLRDGLAAHTSTADEEPFIPLLAEAHGNAGETEKGLSVLDEALSRLHKTGVRYYEAELHRIKGKLLLAREGKNQKAKSKREKVSEAETCMRQAIEIARQQSAKSLELRAVMSLSRLWQRQGKQDEARQMLGEIYGWFTEGFDTADLKEAKELLDGLS
jgi:predicted ATPase